MIQTLQATSASLPCVQCTAVHETSEGTCRKSSEQVTVQGLNHYKHSRPLGPAAFRSFGQLERIFIREGGQSSAMLVTVKIVMSDED